jgi:hypothetical protein
MLVSRLGSARRRITEPAASDPFVVVGYGPEQGTVSGDPDGNPDPIAVH